MKTKYLNIRLTEAQREQLKNNASNLGLTVTSYLLFLDKFLGEKINKLVEKNIKKNLIKTLDT